MQTAKSATFPKNLHSKFESVRVSDSVKIHEIAVNKAPLKIFSCAILTAIQWILTESQRLTDSKECRLSQPNFFKI